MISIVIGFLGVAGAITKLGLKKIDTALAPLEGSSLAVVRGQIHCSQLLLLQFLLNWFLGLMSGEARWPSCLATKGQKSLSFYLQVEYWLYQLKNMHDYILKIKGHL